MKYGKILLLCGFFITSNVFAAPVTEGVDYVKVKPLVSATNPPGTIDVKEFFSFTCIHCKDIEPLIETNIARNKKIYLERIQVAWDAKTSQLAKLNATYQMMGLNKLYGPTFAAIFSNQDLTDNKILTTFLKANQVDVNKFMSNYNSFDVSVAPGKYKSLMTAYNIDGTPTFVVADKYVLKPATPDRLIEVIQYLIKQQKVKP